MITETGKYATEILGFLATYHTETPIYSDDLVDSLATVPGPYAKKILTVLSREKIVLTKKGRGIGCGVRMNPEKLSVSIWDVLSHFDPPRYDSTDFSSGFRSYYDETMNRLELELRQMTVLDLVRS
jgi:DNA-binding IscR family transcriptional regulator